MDYRGLIITYNTILNSASANLFVRDVAELAAAQLLICLHLTCLSEVCCYFSS